MRFHPDLRVKYTLLPITHFLCLPVRLRQQFHSLTTQSQTKQKCTPKPLYRAEISDGYFSITPRPEKNAPYLPYTFRANSVKKIKILHKKQKCTIPLLKLDSSVGKSHLHLAAQVPGYAAPPATGGFAFIDNVNLVAVGPGPAAVPEPAKSGLIAVSLVGAFVARLRRRRNATADN